MSDTEKVVERTIEQVAIFRDVPSRSSMTFSTVVLVIVAGAQTWTVLINEKALDLAVALLLAFFTGTQLRGLVNDIKVWRTYKRALASDAEQAHDEADEADEADLVDLPGVDEFLDDPSSGTLRSRPNRNS